MDRFDLLLPLLPAIGLKLGAAFLCGMLLGIERERKGKPAGLRTITLITVGATVYMIVSALIPLAAGGDVDVVQADPARIAAQVVTGIGFLGAGTIIQSRGEVHGLTTAATIWVAAAIGLCIGLGFPILGFGLTLLVLLSLVVLDPISHYFRPHDAQDEG